MIQNRINLIPHIILASIVFILFIVLGTRVPADLSSELLSQLKESLLPITSMGVIPMLIFIFLNNAFKCLMTIVLGILLGLPSLLFMSLNSLVIGVLVNYLGPTVGTGVIIASLAPHGIIEIPALILSTGMGFAIGSESLKFLLRQKNDVKAYYSYGLGLYFKWILLLLAVASLMEVFITPQVISFAGGPNALLIP